MRGARFHPWRKWTKRAGLALCTAFFAAWLLSGTLQFGITGSIMSEATRIDVLRGRVVVSWISFPGILPTPWHGTAEWLVHGPRGVGWDWTWEHDRGLHADIRAFPLWAALVAIALPTVLIMWQDRHGFGRGLCRSCGYDRAGLTAGAVCPECGRANPHERAA